jgi:hypothetical protein
MSTLAMPDRNDFSPDRPASAHERSHGPDRFGGRERYPAERMKTIFGITERNGRSYFKRIGTGFVNKDESITIKLDAFPVSGTMQVRPYEPPEWNGARPGGGFGDAAGGGFPRDELASSGPVGSHGDPF